ncbi:TPA: type 1 fimbrial protein [Serratia liquefaciens]|nr:type 1 fimbrial protein [Serratia liquefaciens]
MKKTVFLMSLLLGFTFSAVTKAADNATLTFSANITQGTCDISFPAGTTSANAIDIGSVDPAVLIGQTDKTTSAHAFTVRAACQGVAGTGTPGIKLTGSPMTGGAAKLFRDTTGTNSAGFGIAVAQGTGSSIVWTNLKGNGDYLTFTNFDHGGASEHNNDIAMQAAVACGGATECAAANLKTGTLKAAVTFAFAYH